MTAPFTFSSEPVDSNRLYAGIMGLRSIPATRGALGSCRERWVSPVHRPAEFRESSGDRMGLTARAKRVGIILTVVQIRREVRKESPIPYRRQEKGSRDGIRLRRGRIGVVV